MHLLNRVISVACLKFAIAVLLLACGGGGLPSVSAQASTPDKPSADTRPHDALIDSGFERFYNLDYDQAIQDFERALEKHPNDPLMVNHVTTGVLMRELYRMGAMNTGEYANDSFVGQAHRPADPKMKERIKTLVQRAEKLEDQRLSANPNDVDALYARGVTRGQFATIVGAHNYVMGSLPWGVKVAVSLVGLSGSKDKGLQYLSEAADSPDEIGVDAKVVLMLFLRRERRFDEALKVARGVIPRYPQNVLFALEEGNLLRASGHNPDAVAVYRRIWQAGREGHYPGLHYELAALSLGDVLRSDKEYQGAAAAYELVSEVQQPDREYLQKANLSAGEMYDLLKKRDLAVRKYQAVLATNAETPPAQIARKHMKEAYQNE